MVIGNLAGETTSSISCYVRPHFFLFYFHGGVDQS